MSIRQLEELFKAHDFNDFRWIRPENIHVCQWVLFKCIYGCESYGKRSTCPPNNPCLESSKNFISEYEHIAIFHFEKIFTKTEKYEAWVHDLRLQFAILEKAVFLAGYYKVFLLPFGSCSFCSECTSLRANCKNKLFSRPCPEGIGVDVFAAARSVGYNIKVLKNYDEPTNRYAFLLVE